MTIPAWVSDAVFYQIFPDRFANGDPGNDPFNVQPWGSPPTRLGFQGGDLEGIRQKLDYLLDLGINAIYLNPIFLSPSNHRYNTVDYYTIDPKLGSLRDFQALIQSAHQKNIRVILDGVFNHCARGFFAFNDLLENDSASPYQNWFHVRRFPLRAYEPGKAHNYAGWWGHKSLPKFNTDHPPVRRYLLDVARYWLDQGADGWRLDVPNEIDDDDFWAEFRHVARSANPEAYLVGEIWHAWPRWCDDAHFDGLMNYPLRTALIELLSGAIPSAEFLQRVTALLTVYPRENAYAMYNLLGSHDVERILSLLGGDTRKAALAHLLLFALPGAPAVYYGDEIGMQGGKDPDCRGAFSWEPTGWDNGLREQIRRVIHARKAAPALRQGSFSELLAGDDRGTLAFARSHAGETVIVAANAGKTPARIDVTVSGLVIADGQALVDLLNGGEVLVQDGRLSLRLDGYSGAYLRWAV